METSRDLRFFSEGELDRPQLSDDDDDDGERFVKSLRTSGQRRYLRESGSESYMARRKRDASYLSYKALARG